MVAHPSGLHRKLPRRKGSSSSGGPVIRHGAGIHVGTIRDVLDWQRSEARRNESWVVSRSSEIQIKKSIGDAVRRYRDTQYVLISPQPCARLPMAVFGPKRSSLSGPMGEYQFRGKMQR
jgi:hypothetical protein